MAQNNVNIPKLHGRQSEVAKSKARYKVLNWGRRAGKSHLAFIYTYLKAVKNQGRYFIVTRNAKQAKAIYWNDIVKHYLPQEDRKAGKPGFKFNDTELTITFPYLDIPEMGIKHDAEKPQARIEFKSAEEPDSLRGVGIDGVVLDEYAFMKNGEEMWNKIIRPALADKRGWAVFISTPDGIYNHFFDLVQKAQSDETGMYHYSHATALDNPHFPEEEWEITKSEYEEKGKILEFQQEFEAKFSNPAELVYHNFDMEKHVVHPSEVPEDGTHIMGIDFGFSPDPFAVAYILIDKDNNWWIYDEIYQTELTLQKAEQQIFNKMGEQRFSRIIGDSAAKMDIHSMKRLSFPIRGARKGPDSIKAGIREVFAKLEIREGSGKPKLFVASNCKNTIREFQSYEYTKDAYDKITDKPVDDNNHIMDAIRYLALDYARHVNKKKKKERKYDPVTGRVIS